MTWFILLSLSWWLIWTIPIGELFDSLILSHHKMTHSTHILKFLTHLPHVISVIIYTNHYGMTYITHLIFSKYFGLIIPSFLTSIYKLKKWVVVYVVYIVHTELEYFELFALVKYKFLIIPLYPLLYNMPSLGININSLLMDFILLLPLLLLWNFMLHFLVVLQFFFFFLL